MLAAGSANSHRWALLADTHIAADREKLMRGMSLSKNLASVAAELKSIPSLPSAVLINGDCAFNTGEPGDYALFVDLLQPIRQAGISAHLTLGNHDHRDNFWAAVREKNAAPTPIPNRQVALVRTDRANWFLLDSLEKTNSTPGFLGEEQLAWLKQGLDENADKPALIAAHHNLDKSDTKSGLKDTEQLLEIITPRKQVKAYVFAHTHHWSVQQHSSGIHLINLPPVGYPFKEGDAVGWVQADLQPDGVRLELRCLDRAHPSHGESGT